MKLKSKRSITKQALMGSLTTNGIYETMLRLQGLMHKGIISDQDYRRWFHWIVLENFHARIEYLSSHLNDV